MGVKEGFLRPIGKAAMAVARWKYSMLVILIGLATFASIQTYYNSLHHSGKHCKQIETLHIFKFSYIHLIEGKNLYADHLEDHCYTYKYSPAFAVFFGIFNLLPDLPALWLWLMVTVVVTFWALRSLPGVAPPRQFLFLVFISFEGLLCLQAQQTNLLLASLLLLGLIFLEKNKYLPATLCIVLTGFIKLFGFGAFLLFLFYPEKWKLALYTLGWMVLLAIVPLVVVSPDHLWQVYQDWYSQIMSDHSKYAGMSFYGMLGAMTGTEPSKTILLGISLGLLFITVAQYKKWKELWFRQLTLASLLVWMVIFNHKAESPSYVIAMVGMALWFFSLPRKWPDIVLFLYAFTGVSLFFSDLVPWPIRDAYFYPYHLKALPCSILWIRILVDMWVVRKPFAVATVSA